MPSVKDTLNADLSNYVDAPSPPPTSLDTALSLAPVRDHRLRFSAPYLPGTFPSTDTLTGYHLGGKIPQYRMPVPAPPSAGGAGGSSSSGVFTTSSTSTITTNNPPISQTAVFTAASVLPGNNFTGIITMAKTFTILSLTINAAARIRVYSTVAAMNADLPRPITQAPGYATEQGLVGDIYLDTPPYTWQPTPSIVGSNADSPQSQQAYVALTNISQSVQSYSLSVVFVPIQS